MDLTKMLPACSPYVKVENRADIIYSLILHNLQSSEGGSSKEDCCNLLYANGILKKEDPTPLILQHISCFSVVTDYKCGFVCQLCPLSPRYKNLFEEEESLILAYGLKSWDNFKFLKENGCTSQFFQSQFLINEFPTGKIVATLPLFRLSFHYLDQKSDQNTAFSRLPAAIAYALEQNNREKLVLKNSKKIESYLTRLQKEFPVMQKDDIKKMLIHCQNPTASLPASGPPKEPIKDHPENCLEGLLNNSKHPVPADENKNVDIQTKIKATKQTEQIEKPSIEENRSILPANDMLLMYPGNQLKATTKAELPFDEKEIPLYLPSSFSIQEGQNTGYPFHVVNENYADLRQFEAFLLYNPWMALEVVTDVDSRKPALLFCASGLFYYAFADDELIVNLLSNYFSKSDIRCQICLEPYRLYYYLQRNGLNCKNVYSLRTAHMVLAEAQKRNHLKSPENMVKELTSRTNLHGLSRHIFCMLQYIKMYEILVKHSIFSEKVNTDRFMLLNGIDTLLGISYELKDVTETKNVLFTLNDKREFKFSYTPDTKMKLGICSVTFTLSADKPLNDIIMNLLYRFATQDLSAKLGYRLLSYSQDSFTIASTEKNYPQLCDTVTNLATYLAEKQELIPLTIKEDKNS